MIWADCWVLESCMPNMYFTKLLVISRGVNFHVL